MALEDGLTCWAVPLLGGAVGCDGGGWVGAVAIGGAVLAWAASVVQAARARRGGRGAWVWALPVVVAGIGWLLAAAAEAPWLARGGGTAEGRHLAVVVDASASARRTPEQLPTALQRLGERLGDASRRSQPLDTASVLLVADGIAEVRKRAPLAGLAGALPGLAGEPGPPDGESDLATGIRAAARHVRTAGGSGAVLLLSDGLETRGDAAAAAREAGRLGIPVHTVPVASPSPGIGLVASHLPPRVAAGFRTQLRLMIANPHDRAAGFRLRAWLNGTGAPAEGAETVPPEAVGSAMLPLEFSGRGLQFVDVELTPIAGGPAQRRRLYTQVDAPTRVAALGPAPWLSGLPDGAYRVMRPAPGEAFDVDDLDVVVIDGVPADRLASGQAERIAAAVRGKGLGLLLVNGPHRGRSEDPTVLMGYEATALDPLLPVSSKPREERVEPPGRQIVVMIDTSGSMCGAPLALAQELAGRIVEQLRARDTLTVTAFASGFQDVLSNAGMGPDGKARARSAIGSLACGGGTDPNAALQRLSAKDGRRCGLFFISDGEFDLRTRQPGCMTTVFAIGQTASSVNGAIHQLGEVHFVNDSRDMAGLRLGFFDPEKRNKTFEPGRYRPDALIPTSGYLPDPPQELDGNAVSFPRERVELAATRPYPVDPVLAFLDSGAGTAAAFTTEVPAGWGHGGGARAIAAWMERLAAWPRRDRYLFDLVDDGGSPTLLVSLAVQDGRTPTVEQLSASLRAPTGDLPLRTDADPTTWGRFRVRLPVPSGVDAATLVLRETGPDALDREQRIPIRLGGPERGVVAASSEQWAFGINAELLKAVAAASGGTYDPPPSVLGGAAPKPPLAVPLWTWFLALAALVYVTMIAFWKVRR
ncbi:vWA domain-containing protein [Azospirillum canadense]|uniref:vWA domain-containing protein n=1 Tax=Azospirillum canadense TaxID=403962 RepID=UPI002227ECBA|nr:VWA domain-containing protein [Azospirillum canadense]MCW2243153.1 Mg-chelatase subunit ChlD [Azospirillum canadense]